MSRELVPVRIKALRLTQIHTDTSMGAKWVQLVQKTKKALRQIALSA
jgi:hypothetical protein